MHKKKPGRQAASLPPPPARSIYVPHTLTSAIPQTSPLHPPPNQQYAAHPRHRQRRRLPAPPPHNSDKPISDPAPSAKKVTCADAPPDAGTKNAYGTVVFSVPGKIDAIKFPFTSTSSVPVAFKKLASNITSNAPGDPPSSNSPLFESVKEFPKFVVLRNFRQIHHRSLIHRRNRQTVKHAPARRHRRNRVQIHIPTARRLQPQLIPRKMQNAVQVPHLYLRPRPRRRGKTQNYSKTHSPYNSAPPAATAPHRSFADNDDASMFVSVAVFSTSQTCPA